MPCAGLLDKVQRRLIWPLPALACWGLGWLAFIALGRASAPGWLTLALPTVLCAVLGALGGTAWRRLIMVAGFPLSIVALGAASERAAWLWLLPLAVLALAYPVHAWRDAPLFPTPRDALQGLASRAPLAPGARVLDAGCGTGDGLRALRRVYPEACLEGIEWSWPWALLARWRCRWARVRRGDMWTDDWRGFALVYLFQRPESMARAAAKAQRELAPGAWLVSLEFPVPSLTPHAVIDLAGTKPVWVYRITGS